MGFNSQAYKIIAEGGGNHDGKVLGLPPGIKEKAQKKDSQIFQFFGRQKINEHRGREKPEQKQDAAENHIEILPDL